MFLHVPEICQHSCETWTALGGNDIYVVEKSLPGLQPAKNGPRCIHSSATFRIVTRTFPAFIVACGATESSVMEDFAALQSPPSAVQVDHVGVLGRSLLSSSGRHMLNFHGMPHFQGVSFQASCTETMLSYTFAHESVVVHPFLRLGGYLRLLGYPQAAGFQVALAGFLVGLTVIHGMVGLAALGVALGAMARLHAAVRRNPQFIPQTLEEGPENMTVSRQVLAEAGTFLTSLAALLLWQKPLHTWLAVLGVLVGIGALLMGQYTSADLHHAVLTNHLLAAALLLYVLFNRWWGRETAKWLQQARSLEETLCQAATQPQSCSLNGALLKEAAVAQGGN
eukprot:GGOE01061776.1.p1 GENE.GGOE01061776.1~~GGOE01061776.1.p1  ORF type:complete len:338 (+),score=47.15 GGOE01061776.1:73-1086(+)